MNLIQLLGKGSLQGLKNYQKSTLGISYISGEFMMYVKLVHVLVLGVCFSNVTVKMPPTGSNDLSVKSLPVQVQVNDLRNPGIVASKREAPFGIPMGEITFAPSEEQLLKETLGVGLMKLLVRREAHTKETYSFDLIEFGVSTKATPLYWDVVGRISLILRHGGKEYSLFGTHTERTYIWPGEGVIKNVVEESLKQVAASLESAVGQEYWAIGL
jgi:hypothetical protein